MKQSFYIKVVMLLLSFVYISCNKEIDNNKLQLDNMFLIYGDEIQNKTIFLNNIIEQKEVENDVILDDNYKFLCELIHNYYDYLDSLDIKSLESKANLFYRGSELLHESKIFSDKTNVFLQNVENKIKNKQYLVQYLHSLFDVADIKNEEDFYIDYIVYYYHSFPYQIFNYNMKSRKYDLVLFQNEVLDNFLIKN